MSAAKHTSGPWSVVELPESSYGDFKVRMGRTYINVDDEANAKLIAAAPDLAEALIWILTNEHIWSQFKLPGFDNDMDKARAALAKAGL